MTTQNKALHHVDAMLQSLYGQDPIACAATKETRRFTRDGIDIEIYFDGDALTAVGTVCELNGELDEIYTKIRAANASKVATGKVFEADNYLRVQATCPVATASADAIRTTLESVLALAKEPAVRSIKTNFGADGY